MRTTRIRGRTERHTRLDTEVTGAFCDDCSWAREVADDIGSKAVRTARAAGTGIDLQRRHTRNSHPSGTSGGAADQPLTAIAIQYLQRQRDIGHNLALRKTRAGQSRVIEDYGERVELTIRCCRDCVKEAIRAFGAQRNRDGLALNGRKGERRKVRQVRYRNGRCGRSVDCVDGVRQAAAASARRNRAQGRELR